MSKDMDNKKIRVAYYDCVDESKLDSRKDAELFANWAIHCIERNNNAEVVFVMIEIEKQHMTEPYSAFIYGVVNGKYGEIDKVVMRSKKIFENIRDLKLMHLYLKHAGISLEFVIEGEVDERFIEAYEFVENRMGDWKHRQNSSKYEEDVKQVIILPDPKDDKNFGPKDSCLRCVFTPKKEIVS